MLGKMNVVVSFHEHTGEQIREGASDRICDDDTEECCAGEERPAEVNRYGGGAKNDGFSVEMTTIPPTPRMRLRRKMRAAREGSGMGGIIGAAKP